MDDAALVAEWRARFEAPTKGRDFSELGGPMTVDEPPWSYADLARTTLRDAGSALDMGTGCGEVLLGLADALPVDSVATEGWPPNLSVARENLSPIGIDVVPYDAEEAGLVVTDARQWTGSLRRSDVATMLAYYAEVLLDLHHFGPELVFTQPLFVLASTFG